MIELLVIKYVNVFFFFNINFDFSVVIFNQFQINEIINDLYISLFFNLI